MQAKVYLGLVIHYSYKKPSVKKSKKACKQLQAFYFSLIRYSCISTQ